MFSDIEPEERNDEWTYNQICLHSLIQSIEELPREDALGVLKKLAKRSGEARLARESSQKGQGS